MNKIVLDKENIINLNVIEDSVLNITKDYNIKELNVVVNKNVKIIINHYSEINKNEFNLNVEQKDNSEFVYNHSFVCKDNYKLSVDVKMDYDNSKNIINIHGISDAGNTFVKLDGRVLANTKNNELYENVKLLNINDGFSNVYPNMFIDTKNVVANHAASISTIDDNYLFYLMCKGIKKDDAIKLIIGGFLDNDAKLE